MNFAVRSIALLTVSVVLVACGKEAEAPRLTDSTGNHPADRDSIGDRTSGGDTLRRDTTKTLPQAERPASKTDSIALEGTPEAFEMTLVESAMFSTYYPAKEMIVDQSSSDEGTGVRFIANFAGTRNDDAFLHIFTPNDPAAGREEATRLLLGDNGIVRSNGWTAEKHTMKRCDWAPESYAISGRKGTGHLIGFACVGEHRRRGFVAIAVYPEDYVEGMGPRVGYILDELRWNDTGAPLALE